MANAAPGLRDDKGRYRVMVVDDSAVIRGILTRWLEADPTLEVVASCANGLLALKAAREKPCDVIVLDIEMPEMDGLTALPQLVRAIPGVQVVMASTLTRRNADVSLKALAMGAADYLAKPESLREGTTAEDFHRDLLDKVKNLAAVGRRKARWRTGLSTGSPAAVSGRDGAVAQPTPASTLKLRPWSSERPAILAIGSSTGGPQALLKVLALVGPSIEVPILVTQHMPATFTTILAEHIAKASGRPCTEGETGQSVQPGHIYVAPGGAHMEIERAAAGKNPTINLSHAPPENFCRPAVDPMFRSVARVYGARTLAVVLTGMGADGREGARAIAAAGGTIVAQDEPTSVVWGMPGAVATAGLASAIWPLDRVGPELVRVFAGGARAS